jgi:hypothetical protein
MQFLRILVDSCRLSVDNKEKMVVWLYLYEHNGNNKLLTPGYGHC